MKKKPQEASRKSDKIVQVLSSAKFIISVAVIIGVSTFLAWQYHNTTNADRVFWGMVDENLQTSAYSRNTVQKNGSQSVTQVIQTATSPQQLIYSQTVFQQTGVDSATAITENIGTPTEDYVRYNSIVTSQKSANGGQLDFSDVVGKWAAAGSGAGGETTGQQYNQAVLGIIPTGNLSSAERRAIIKTMKDQGTYRYSVIETKRTWPFGRPTYTFQVTVSPEGYITTLKQFAEEVGLNHLEKVQPADYASSQKLTFIVSVDGWTHQMTRADQNQGARSETISGRNLKKTLPSTPSDTIPVDELQARLQSVQ